MTEKKTATAEKKTASKMSKDDLINVIKEMTVLELADLIKALETEFGVVAAAPMAASMGASSASMVPAPAAPPVEEQTEFTVILKEIGPNKINVIKAVREITTLGLKEAKDLVEAAPKTIKEAVPKAEAEALKAKLEGAGAAVEIK